jgi:hypothetical protein
LGPIYAAGNTCSDTGYKNQCTVNGVSGQPCCQGTTMYGLQSTCIRSYFSPSIAIDRLSSPNLLVVAYGTPGSSGCTQDNETRWYTSNQTNAGSANGWVYSEVTGGCANTFHPWVAAANTPWGWGTAGLFQTAEGYVSGSSELSEVQWRSTNGGSIWSGTYVSNPRPTTSPAGEPPGPTDCWAGDFDGITYDGENSSFFYTWADQTSGVWQITGEAVNQ